MEKTFCRALRKAAEAGALCKTLKSSEEGGVSSDFAMTIERESARELESEIDSAFDCEFDRMPDNEIDCEFDREFESAFICKLDVNHGNLPPPNLLISRRLVL